MHDIGIDMVAEAADAFAQAFDVLQAAGRRRSAYMEFLRAMGREEAPMSRASVCAEINLLGNRFYFDNAGNLHYDDRFVLPHERRALERVEALYRRMNGIPAAPKVKQARAGKIHAKTTSPAVRKPAQPTPPAPPPPTPELTLSLPVFRGFEDARYQDHDALIIRLVDDFNRRRRLWAGATSAQEKGIHDLSPELVKAHMIEESGGGDPRSRAAWSVDPLQVNVPGDWDPQKASLGLSKPSRRNEGNRETNVKAAIAYLARKGFGPSARPAADIPSAVFDGWQTALQRYNGRNDETRAGRRYKEEYAERIMLRAQDPDNFVPISIQTKKKK